MTYNAPLSADEARAIVRRVLAGEPRTEVAVRFGVNRQTVDRQMRRLELLLGRRPSRRSADLEWMNKAACAGLMGFTEMPVQDQLTVCRGPVGVPACPVRSECLEYGLQMAGAWGKGDEGPVYGGLPPYRLRRMQKERAS